MKDLKEIEKLLRDSRLPDTDFTRNRHETWRKLIEAQRRRRKSHILPFVPPWIWALASLILLLLSILLMLWLR